MRNYVSQTVCCYSELSDSRMRRGILIRVLLHVYITIYHCKAFIEIMPGPDITPDLKLTPGQISFKLRFCIHFPTQYNACLKVTLCQIQFESN